MVALKAERRVWMWRVYPQVRPSGAAEAGKTATLDEVISVLEGEHSAGRARVYLKGGSKILEDTDPARDEKNQLFIASIKRDPIAETVTLLISRGDPEVADPSFVDAGKNKVRVTRPKGDETPGWSAHLVISTKLTGGVHRACFEQMAHVPSGIALQALDHIVSNALLANPTYRFAGSKMVKGKSTIVWHDYRPRLEVERVPSERLIDDLDDGTLSGMTLTRARTYYAGPGAQDTVKIQEEKIYIGLQKTTKDAAKELLGNIIQKAKTDKFETVTFHVDDLPGKQTSHPTIPLAEGDALEHLYVRAKRLVDFAKPLETCYSEVCVEIETKMAAVLNEPGDW